MKRGQLDEALANYQRAVEPKSDRPDIRNNLGLVLEKLGQTDEATAQFQEALKLEPDFTDAHNNLGNALEKRGRIAEATAHYERALEIDPDHAQGHNDLGPSWPGADGSTKPSRISKGPSTSSPTTLKPTSTWAPPWRSRTDR